MGLEGVVRPAVFPDIRPKPGRDARVTDPDPSRDRATIGGTSSGQVIDLNQSQNMSTQKQHVSEEYRVFDIIRIYRVKPATNPDLLPPTATEPGAVKPARQDAGINYKLPLQSGERIDRSVWQDQEVMWQIITVLHTGETRRTIYKRPDPADHPKGNMVVIQQDIIRKTRGNVNLHDLVLP